MRNLHLRCCVFAASLSTLLVRGTLGQTAEGNPARASLFEQEKNVAIESRLAALLDGTGLHFLCDRGGERPRPATAGPLA